MNRRLEKSNAVHDPERKRKWAMQHECCACCWASPQYAWPAHSVHHIMNGKFNRSDEECNLLMLCHRCHQLAEGEKVPAYPGGYYPKLSLGICLTLKMESDIEHWNPKRLTQLRHSALPELEPVPEIFLRERP